jgi:N,N'-diacetyllegionaminate synthase
MVNSIREVDMAMSGNGIKQPSKSEIKNIKLVRKSIVASKFIPKGETFTEDNITAKRPATGISPVYWDKVIGQKARKDFEADDLIEV